MNAWLQRNWFLIGLLAALWWGLLGWQRLESWADSGSLRSALVAIALCLMALSLPVEALGRSWREPRAVMLAIACNVLLVPLLAWLIGRPLPVEMSTGLVVAGAVPCTLASAAVLARRAHGDDAVAVLVMIITNLFGFIVAPVTLWLLLGTTGDADWDPLAMIGRLFVVAFIPLILGQVGRRFGSLAALAERHRPLIGTICQVAILVMVLFAAVHTGRSFAAAGARDAQTAWTIIATVLAALVTHAAALAIAWQAALHWRLPHADRVAVALAGSQKTLMLGIEVAIGLGASTLPMIAYHVGQLFIDSVVAERWRKQHEAAST
jgi:sodium/bile acid cotransporter 7